MIRLFYGIAVVVVAVLVVLFAYLNPEPVPLKYYGGIDWQVRLPLLLIATFCLGLACAGLASGLKIIYLRRQINQLRRRLQKTD